METAANDFGVLKGAIHGILMPNRQSLQVRKDVDDWRS